METTTSSQLKKQFDLFDRSIREKQRIVENVFLERVQDEIPPMILSQISRGQSPVYGNRFDDYSESYKKQIESKSPKSLRIRFGKRLRPINLKLSGKMLESFFAKIVSFGQDKALIIGFDSPLAKYHTIDGVGKKKTKRKLLPVDGKPFNQLIQRKIVSILKEAMRLFNA